MGSLVTWLLLLLRSCCVGRAGVPCDTGQVWRSEQSAREMRLTQEVRELTIRLTALEEKRQMDLEDQTKRLQVGLLSSAIQTVRHHKYVAHTYKSCMRLPAKNMNPAL